MIETVPETGSTNADLIQRLSDGERFPEGYWLRADSQSKGKGRDGRKWSSEPGNLYTSTIINLRPDDLPPYTLSLVAGIAVYEMLKGQLTYSAEIFLKWPNDVYVRNAKIAGILLERNGDSVVAGIGVNVLFSPELENRQTTCIHWENSRNENGPDAVLKYLAKEFAYELSLWRSDGMPVLLDRWQKRAFPLKTRLSVKDPEGNPVHGFFAGLDQSGALRLSLASGEIKTIHAGDVEII